MTPAKRRMVFVFILCRFLEIHYPMGRADSMGYNPTFNLRRPVGNQWGVRHPLPQEPLLSRPSGIPEQTPDSRQKQCPGGRFWNLRES